MNILFGSSGLVGSFIAKQLKETEHKFLAINRKKLSFLSDEEQQIVINFNETNFSDMNKGFISLGFPLEWYDLIFMRSKIKKIFQEVDYDLIMDVAQRLKNSGCETLSVVSAVGANKSSLNFYLSIKGQLEEDLINLGFSKLILARPGHLLGKRSKKKDIGTRIIEFIGLLSHPFMIGKLKKYRNIKAEKIASLLIEASSDKYEDGTYAIEFDEIKKI